MQGPSIDPAAAKASMNMVYLIIEVFRPSGYTRIVKVHEIRMCPGTQSADGTLGIRRSGSGIWTLLCQVPAWIDDGILMRSSENVSIQLRSPRRQVFASHGRFKFSGSAESCHNAVAQQIAFGNDVAVRVDNHRVSVSNLVIVHADWISEDSVDAVVVRSGR